MRSFLFQLDATLSTTHGQLLAPILDPLDVKITNKLLENGPIESNAHIVIASNVLQSQAKLNYLSDTVKHSGFVIVSEYHGMPESAIENSDFVLVSKLSSEDKSFYLLRKVRM